MLNTIDLNVLPVSFKANLVDSDLFVNCTSTEVLSFCAGLASTGINCDIILVDVCRFKLVYINPWEVDVS
jgi:hypothetical protein